MSIGKSMWVACDGDRDEDCDEEFLLMGAAATVSQVRVEAKRQGWAYRGGLDLCPAHSRG